jgi:hypothetical protein
MAGRRLIDLTGQRLGKLLVLHRTASFRYRDKLIPAWLCRCDCGREAVIRGASLRPSKGRKTGTQSCGCLHVKHGMYGTPEYSAWQSMRGRCENPKMGNYYLYGGRGISVCERWSASFEAFLKDMGLRPSPDHSLDRYPNNDGNYEPGNCRWATRKQQQRNRRTCHVLTVNGVSATLAEWAERTGLGKGTIRERVRRGWSPERATGTTVP